MAIKGRLPNAIKDAGPAALARFHALREQGVPSPEATKRVLAERQTDARQNVTPLSNPPAPPVPPRPGAPQRTPAEAEAFLARKEEVRSRQVQDMRAEDPVAAMFGILSRLRQAHIDQMMALGRNEAGALHEWRMALAYDAAQREFDAAMIEAA